METHWTNRQMIDLVWVLVCLLLLKVRKCEALDLTGKLAEQSSTNAHYVASKAIDGSQTTFSVTVSEINSWWRVDLGDAYCLKKITVQVRLDCCADRLDTSTVRAGFSPDYTLNRIIGPRISVNESSLGVLLPFVPSPLVTARYVSVNQDQLYSKIVSLAEVTVDELLDTDAESEVTEEGLDFTLVISPPVVGQGDIVISAYKGCRDITADVSFGRQLTTGGTQSGLPSQSSEGDDIYHGRATRSLFLPDLDGNDRIGVFYSEVSKNENTTRIQTIILPNNDANVHIVPVYRTLTTNIGETVDLQMLDMNSPNSNYRWKHNEDVIAEWNNQLTMSIPSVVKSDEGIYSCFVDGQENQQRHGIMRLIVRGCAAGMWGPPSCSLVCNKCHYGGVCDEITGTCVCAPGFSGVNCEQSHGRHVFGKIAERSCSTSTDPHHNACQGHLFCLRDPYGCSCAAGFHGIDCMPECENGTYGVDCKQTCRCAAGQTCSKDTGQCSGDGCASPYFGYNCLCSREGLVVGLEVTLHGPYGLSATWHPDSCYTNGYFMKLTDTASSLVVAEQQTNNTEEYVFVDGLQPFTEYLMQIAANTSEGPGPYGDGVTGKTAEAEPSAPLGVTIRNAYRSALTVEWVEPNPPNGIIINYDMTFWRVDGSSPTTVLTDIQPGNNLIYQIISLSIDSAYYIQVRAKTSVGVGPWSDVINGETQSEAFEFVTNLRLMDRTNTTVTLQWDLPSNIQGQDQRRYMLEYRALEKPDQPSFIATDEYIQAEVEVLPHSLADLEPGTKYEIRVSVLDEDSTEGAAVFEVYTRPQYGESLVVGLEVTLHGPYRVSATWYPDNCYTNGYFVKLTDTASSLVIAEQQTNNTEEYVVVDGLEPFTEYLLQVAANTSGGPGPYGDGVTVRTAEAEPSAPVNVTIRNAYRSALTVEWVPPNPPNGIIINYDMTFWRVDGSSSTTVLTDIQPGNNLIYQIISLSIDSAYYIQVRAKTYVGAGPWSDVIIGTTQLDAFEFVTNIRLMDRTDTTVALQWDLPSNIQGQRSYMLEYKALEKPYQPSFTATDEYIQAEVEVLPHSLADLEPGTKYEIRISLLDEDSTEGAAVFEVFTRPQYDPPEPLSPTSHPDESTPSTVTISLNTASFDDAYIFSYLVRVKKTTPLSATMTKTKREVLLLLHYAESPFDYIAAELFKQSATEGFVIGDGETYGGYYNAPLHSDSDYEIRVGALSKGNGTEVSVTFSEPVSVTVPGIESCGDGGGVGNTVIVIVLVIVLGVFLLSIGLIVVSLLYRRNRYRSSVNTMFDGQVASQFVRKVESSSNEVQPCDDISLWTSKCDLDWEDLTIDSKSLVGKGCFTVVCKGKVMIDGQITNAAIKTLKADVPRNARDDLVRDFLAMRMIGPHPNIVAMLGACSHDGILYVATEFLSKGSLRKNLRNNRPLQLKRQQLNTEGKQPLTFLSLLRFGVDVAKGMEHLSQCGIVHRDLCARNVLLGEDMTAKIADLGLPKGERSAQQCSGRRVATRWLSIESLTLKIHVCKSDIWSFGILLWEIVTFGGTPYPDIESKDIAGQLMSGYRLPKPGNCADELYGLMSNCWQLEPKDRPCFQDVRKDLLRMINASQTHNKSPPISTPTIFEGFSFIDPELDDI